MPGEHWARSCGVGRPPTRSPSLRLRCPPQREGCWGGPHPKSEPLSERWIDPGDDQDHQSDQRCESCAAADPIVGGARTTLSSTSPSSQYWRPPTQCRRHAAQTVLSIRSVVLCSPSSDGVADSATPRMWCSARERQRVGSSQDCPLRGG